MKLTFSRFVDGDLRNITAHISDSSTVQAERMAFLLQSEIDRIRIAPLHYQVRPELGPGARLAVVGQYLILFRISERQFRIERVVHGSRYLPTLFEDALKNG